MNWISIINEIPPNGAIVFARTKGKTELLCKFTNDSFGIGDMDFEVVKWRYAVPPTKEGQAFRHYTPRSTSHTEDHKDVYSLELLQNLGT